MALVIDLESRRTMSGRQRHVPPGDAKILIFNGVRFERLESSVEQQEETSVPIASDAALRNKTG